MKKITNRAFSGCCRQVASIFIAIGIAAVPIVHAQPNPGSMPSKHPGKIALVRPADLPEQARQDGEAMLLHQTSDGRTILYIEQSNGGRLAVLDVTDPSHIQGETSVRLDAPGPFDFVSPLGNRAELIRFRQGRGAATLDLHEGKAPTMDVVPGLDAQSPKESLGEDAILLTSADQPAAQPALDYQIVATANSRELNPVFSVKGVREEITNPDTGTTFLLASDGLYLIRRPAVEQDYKMHQAPLAEPQN